MSLNTYQNFFSIGQLPKSDYATACPSLIKTSFNYRSRLPIGQTVDKTRHKDLKVDSPSTHTLDSSQFIIIMTTINIHSQKTLWQKKTYEQSNQYQSTLFNFIHKRKSI